MTSEEDSCFPLILSPGTMTKDMKSQDESSVPSTMISMNSRLLPPSRPRGSSRTDSVAKEEAKRRRQLNKSRKCVNDNILANISSRLTKRKKLHKKWLVHFSFVLFEIFCDF